MRLLPLLYAFTSAAMASRRLSVKDSESSGICFPIIAITIAATSSATSHRFSGSPVFLSSYLRLCVSVYLRLCVSVLHQECPLELSTTSIPSNATSLQCLCDFYVLQPFFPSVAYQQRMRKITEFVSVYRAVIVGVHAPPDFALNILRSLEEL